MKKIILAILMLSSLSMMAQQKEEQVLDSKLKALKREKNVTVRQQKIKALENGTDEDLMLLIQYYDKNTAKKEALTKTLQKKYPQSQNARMMRMMSF